MIDVNFSNNPFKKRSNVIKIGDQILNTLRSSNSKALSEKLEDLRYKLKSAFNIHSLHHVFSAPVQNQLSKYAPISIQQLKHFEITSRKIDQYGAEIINVIKQYLHENGLVSPFLKITTHSSSNTNTNTKTTTNGNRGNRSVLSAPPMCGGRRRDRTTILKIDWI